VLIATNSMSELIHWRPYSACRRIRFTPRSKHQWVRSGCLLRVRRREENVCFYPMLLKKSGVRLDQAGVDREAFAADRAFSMFASLRWRPDCYVITK
jgi:hypothetical protein